MTTYQTPNGVSLGELLGLLFSHPAGIATAQNEDGTWELRAWPVGLGSRPTQLQVTSWANSQLSAKSDRLADAEMQNAKMIRAVCIALKVQFPSLDLPRLLTDAKAAYKNL